MEEFVSAYKASLEDLTFNSKPVINTLTILADENRKYASEVVRLVEDRIKKSSQTMKLPCLYLLDSIVKNLGGNYPLLFENNLVETFTTVFQMADEKVRKDLYKLRNTWKMHFPADILRALDVKTKDIDPNWPILKVSASRQGQSAGNGSSKPAGQSAKTTSQSTGSVAKSDAGTARVSVVTVGASTAAATTSMPSNTATVPAAAPVKPAARSSKIHINPNASNIHINPNFLPAGHEGSSTSSAADRNLQILQMKREERHRLDGTASGLGSGDPRLARQEDHRQLVQDQQTSAVGGGQLPHNPRQTAVTAAPPPRGTGPQQAHGKHILSGSEVLPMEAAMMLGQSSNSHAVVVSSQEPAMQPPPAAATGNQAIPQAVNDHLMENFAPSQPAYSSHPNNGPPMAFGNAGDMLPPQHSQSMPPPMQSMHSMPPSMHSMPPPMHSMPPPMQAMPLSMSVQSIPPSMQQGGPVNLPPMMLPQQQHGQMGPPSGGDPHPQNMPIPLAQQPPPQQQQQHPSQLQQHPSQLQQHPSQQQQQQQQQPPPQQQQQQQQPPPQQNPPPQQQQQQQAMPPQSQPQAMPPLQQAPSQSQQPISQQQQHLDSCMSPPNFLPPDQQRGDGRGFQPGSLYDHGFGNFPERPPPPNEKRFGRKGKKQKKRRAQFHPYNERGQGRHNDGYGRQQGISAPNQPFPNRPVDGNVVPAGQSGVVGAADTVGMAAVSAVASNAATLKMLLSVMAASSQGAEPLQGNNGRAAWSDGGVGGGTLPEQVKPNSLQLPTIKLNDHEQLKREYPAALEMLYTGRQCSSCGQRFTQERSQQYQQHLDWHFHRNQLTKENKGQSRAWLVPLDDWVRFVEGEKIQDRSVFFDQEDSEEEAEEGEISCPVGADTSQTCVICKEPLEAYWREEEDDDGEGEWHYREAVRVSGKLYHHQCYEDSGQVPDTPTPDIENKAGLEDPLFGLMESTTSSSESDPPMDASNGSKTGS